MYDDTRTLRQAECRGRRASSLALRPLACVPPCEPLLPLQQVMPTRLQGQKAFLGEIKEAIGVAAPRHRLVTKYPYEGCWVHPPGPTMLKTLDVPTFLFCLDSGAHTPSALAGWAAASFTLRDDPSHHRQGMDAEVVTSSYFARCLLRPLGLLL